MKKEGRMNEQFHDDMMRMPSGLIFDNEIPAAVRLAWVQLRRLVQDHETALFSLGELAELTGKHPATLYRHLSVLKERGWLEWRPAGQGRLSISFHVSSTGEPLPDSQKCENFLQNREKISQNHEKVSQKREGESQSWENEGQKRESRAPESPARTADSQKCDNFSQNRESASLKSSYFKLDESLKIKKRGRKIQNRGKPGQESGKAVQKSGNDPLDDSLTPAQLYRRMARISPNLSQRAHIEVTVRDDELWRESIDHWLMHGWNPRNLQGMLELYERGGPSGCRFCSKPDADEQTNAMFDAILMEYADGRNL